MVLLVGFGAVLLCSNVSAQLELSGRGLLPDNVAMLHVSSRVGLELHLLPAEGEWVADLELRTEQNRTRQRRAGMNVANAKLGPERAE